MGNFFAYSNLVNEYDEIMVNVNSFSPTDKKFNYVIFKARTYDDDDSIDSEEETELYVERFYTRYVGIKYNH